jgi:hypothetical protein
VSDMGGHGEDMARESARGGHTTVWALDGGDIGWEHGGGHDGNDGMPAGRWSSEEARESRVAVRYDRG